MLIVFRLQKSFALLNPDEITGMHILIAVKKGSANCLDIEDRIKHIQKNLHKQYEKNICSRDCCSKKKWARPPKLQPRILETPVTQVAKLQKLHRFRRPQLRKWSSIVGCQWRADGKKLFSSGNKLLLDIGTICQAFYDDQTQNQQLLQQSTDRDNYNNKPIWTGEGQRSIEIQNNRNKTLSKFPSFFLERVSPRVFMNQRSSSRLLRLSPNNKDPESEPEDNSSSISSSGSDA
ncbi:hypothetical protein Tco_0575026 [Tanacetum coccineum]